MEVKYAERLKKDQRQTWDFVDNYKAKHTTYPIHPDTEMSMRNAWLGSKNVEDILDGRTNEAEKIFNEWSILFKKYTLHVRGKTVTMIDVPVHDATYKIMIPFNKEVTQ